MNNFKMQLIPLEICLVLASFSAGAAGLGNLTVNSGLGEPFKAEIELLAGTQEIASMSARVATPESYTAQGFERAAVLDNVRIELDKHADGSPILKLSSTQPVDDPYMQLLVQIDWSSGRLLREYNALLDPPGFGERTQARVALPVVSGDRQPGIASNMAVSRPSDERAAGSNKPAANPDDGYVTKRGDTLRQIAARMKSEEVSIEQMLVGLYQTNPSAFAGDNMNRLKVGQILHMPAVDELQAISQKDAVREIRLQTADWRAYRSRLARAVAKAAASNEGAVTAAAKTHASVAEDKTAPGGETRFVLKVSPGDTTYSKEPRAGKEPRSGKAVAGSN